MCFHLRACATLVIAILSAVALGQTAPSNANSAKQTGQVSGRIILDGQPVLWISVFLIPSDNSPRSVPLAHGVSDKDGKFMIKGLPAGAFRLVTEPNPYVVVKSVYANYADSSVVLHEGEQVSNVDLQLRRGEIGRAHV